MCKIHDDILVAQFLAVPPNPTQIRIEMEPLSFPLLTFLGTLEKKPTIKRKIANIQNDRNLTNWLNLIFECLGGEF